MGKIQLSEQQLRNIITESVKKVLREEGFNSLPHLMSKYDPEKEGEYSVLDKLIHKLEPYYDRLTNDTFFANEKPVGNLVSMAAAKKCAIC